MTTNEGECKPAARHAANSDIAPNEVPPGDTAAGDGLHGITTRAGAVTGPPDEIQELRQEIEQTREGLGKTVQQLAAKADVKARARHKTVELTQKVKGKTSATQAQAAASAGNARSQIAEKTQAARQQVMPVVSAGRDQLQARAAAVGMPVWEATPEAVRQAVAKGASTARQRRAPLIGAASALIAGYLAVRWWNRR